MQGTALIERLSAICREHFLDEKIVIAPTLAIGHQIGDALAFSGTPWINLRFESIRTLVDAVIGFDLAEEGTRVRSRAQALAMVETACDEALPPGSYFASLSDRPGLHRAVQRTLDDLRFAGVTAEAINPRELEDERKGRDLLAILAAYDRALREARSIDRAGVLARAIARLEKNESPWDPSRTIWIVLDEVELTAEEEKFLKLAAGEKLQRVAVSPEHDGEEGPDAVRIVRAIGEENELRAAFRALLGERQPFDGAELIYSRREPYLPLAYELASELQVPCTFAEGVASSFTRPGQACLAFLEWIGGGWEARVLQQAVRGGTIVLPRIASPGGGSERLSSSGFVRVLRDARIGWGRERYLARLDALAARLAQPAPDDERNRSADDIRRELAQVDAVRELCAELLDITGGVAEGAKLSMPSLAAAAALFVRRLVAVRSEIDGMARSALVAMFDELADLPSTSVGRSEGSRRLRDAVQHLHVAASNPRPGHLHVTPIRAGGWSGRRRAFIVGLDDTKYPGSAIQDPILLDSEREAINRVIGPRLEMRGEAPERMSKQFRQLLQRLVRCEELFVSFPMLDVIERRGLYPSSAVLEAFRRSSRRAEATYHDVIGAAGEAKGFADAVAASEPEWWLPRRHRPKAPPDEAARAYPWLADGQLAAEMRESNALTKWDGLIVAPREEIDPRHTGRVYSASQLETMAKCPIGYFFERHLHIKRIDELERDPDVWLSAMDYGAIFHKIAERFMKQVCEGGKAPRETDRPLLDTIAEQELQAWRAIVPPPNETAFEKQRDDLFATLTIFFRGELECGAVRARYFEASFGFPREEGTSLALPEPLVIDLGGGRSVKLRGRIDRVDFDETTGVWNVWDYKTGSTYEYRADDRLARGTKIQHAIYARAICAMLEQQGGRVKVGQSGYYFPTPKARALRLPRECGDGELERALNLLFDVVGNGFFPHPEKESCKFCEHLPITGDAEEAAERMRRKFEANAAHPAVKAWLALQEVK